MRSLALLLALGLSACVAAPVAGAGPARCDVTIKFGSYGAGIDHMLADKVAAAIQVDRDIARSERKPWGREGEFDQCLTAKPGRDVKAMYERYRAMLPARNLKAPTSIEGPDGLRFETIAPM
ncbi:hypothetical protein [Caulobacter vibrioides]|uniref:Uncharacterized protein n=2 Tax=Caulobacter vibrioides TaxID=155892 RepID=Q9AAX6_CAUVC|nr:hypothetical protein [Caulobacter vibrioides]YP_002515872.1 hypothetical protein CCNA_00499 [Caulobacter vibrioides NA1000]AAK22453.1 hypothetical protein CC_0466 [Caulobacter vibrioides CB15]ACL93964.1 hypothetical protein CCNA_00499 [Caulobacter vibrioides NA1000]QXZ52556.1 hypothetical protein KZH45_02420 [Caulobacter vibrioides]